MAVIALICKEEKARRELALAVEELGHRVVSAVELREGLEILSRERPQLMLIAEPAQSKDAERLMGELEREAPLLPVVVALGARSAARVMELLKAGVYEVIVPPWTTENLAACLSKALRFKGTAFEVVRTGGQRRATIYFCTALLVLMAALGYARLERKRREAEPKPIVISSWSLPYSHPAGLAYDGKDFWVSDWFSQTLYRHSPADLRVLRARNFPKEVPGALAFAGDALWVAAAPRGIVKHMLDDKLSALQWVADLPAQTLGMAYDGLYMWTCDSRTGKIHKRILDDSLSVVRSFNYPGSMPAALAYDGRALWSLDAGNRELLRHDLDDPEKVMERIPLPEYRSGEWKPTGLAWDGKHFWTVAERRPKGDGPAHIFMHVRPAAADPSSRGGA